MGSYEVIRGRGGEDDNDNGTWDGNGLRMITVATAFQQPPKAAAASASPSIAAAPPHARSNRLISLDVFRGLTVALMILVDDAGGIFPAINHSPWNGLTLADFVMPFFSSLLEFHLHLQIRPCLTDLLPLNKQLFELLKLLILGIFLQGGYFHGLKNLEYGIDIEEIRWTGILQCAMKVSYLMSASTEHRIAVAYLVAAVCEIWLKGDGKANSTLSLIKKYRAQWAVVLVLTSLYLAFLYGLYVPDWDYQIPAETSSLPPKIFSVECGVRGDTGPACNAAGMIDRSILGIRHLYRRPIYARMKQCSINSPDYGPLPADAPSWCQAPFDPEGLLSSLMAIVTCLIGLQYAHVIAHFKDHGSRLLQWIIPSVALLVIGSVFDLFGMHVNKALYTVSYTCITAGSAGILFAVIYLMVDVYGYRRSPLVLEWMGRKALLIFILVACNILPVILQGFYWKQPQNNILKLIRIKT